MRRDAKATIEYDDIQSSYRLTDEQMEGCPIGEIEEDMIGAGVAVVEEWVRVARLKATGAWKEGGSDGN